MQSSSSTSTGASSSPKLPNRGSPPPPRRPYKVPSLINLCVSTISSKIERYPPECLGILSELEWESVCKLRHKRTCPRQKTPQQQQQQPQQACLGSLPTSSSTSSGGIDGTGRMAPAISDKVMKSIEDANEHLASSSVTDTIIWKDCVEYRFRIGGPSRPPALLYPWPILVERLKKAGSDLLEMVKSPPPREQASIFDDDINNNDRGGKERDLRLQQAKALDKCMRILSESPMTVPLLTATNVGKSVSKFIKGCNKLRDVTDVIVVDVWTPRRMISGGCSSSFPGAMKEEAPIQRLECLLSGWKDIASAKGVTIRQSKHDVSSFSSSETISAGRGKKTSNERHSKDVSIMSSCQSWRELHEALVERESEMMKSHGERMRKIRDDIDANKKKIAKVTVRPRGRGPSMGGTAKREAILSGQRGLRAMASASSSSSSSSFFGGGGGGSKIQQLRRETAVAATFSKGGRSKFTQRSKASFANSIANASGAAAAASSLKRRHVMGSSGAAAGGGGKKMKLPKSIGVGRGEVAFSSMRQERDRQKQRKSSGGSSSSSGGRKSVPGSGRSFRR